MNTTSSLVPDAVRMSYLQSLRLNAWAIVAVVIAMLSRLGLSQSQALSEPARAGIALLPLIPACLYLLTLWRWMQGLDEFQRRLQQSAVNFAAFGMLLLTLTADLLRGAAVAPRINFGWEGYFVLTFALYAFGLMFANRRYR
ncbi:MAG: hypothetical protein JNK85_02975 [Verrucomicrobiales bacterium]|nr:hypothetical protein [Verrucomicrobiales bacterium]